jgi:hypothetical protein
MSLQLAAAARQQLTQLPRLADYAALSKLNLSNCGLTDITFVKDGLACAVEAGTACSLRMSLQLAAAARLGVERTVCLGGLAQVSQRAHCLAGAARSMFACS